MSIVEMFPPEAESSYPRYPRKELPAHFDQVYAKLRGAG
jgi:hypothetical protein